MDWLSARDPMSAWTHFAWMVLAVPGTVLLLWLSRKQPRKQASMLVFGLSLVLCYGGSFLYHYVPLEMSEPFNVLDHLGISVLIAGTVTPIAVVGLRGRWRVALLILIWVLAAAGITLRLSGHSPLAVRTVFYLLMGWVGVVTYFQLVRRLSHAKVSLIWIGGILYSVGAVINAMHYPSFTTWFDSHDLFHLFVMAGSLAHYGFMLVALNLYRDAVAPLPKVPARAFPVGDGPRPQTAT
jgi:hemolysin III